MNTKLEKVIKKTLLKHSIIEDRDAEDLSRIIVKRLKKAGFFTGQIHPDFKSCSKCLYFHDAPHHEKCIDCDCFSNFVSAEKICSKCGNHIGGIHCHYE